MDQVTIRAIENLELFFLGLLTITVLIIIFFTVKSPIKKTIERLLPMPELPIELPLLWGGTTSERDILLYDVGTINKYRYMLYGVVSFEAAAAFRVLEIVLRTPSPVHIICMHTNSPILNENWKSEVSKHSMEPVVLEGDFPDYFTMFASTSRQMEVREVYDPKMMAYFVDFCQNFDFEVVGQSLLVSVHSDRSTQDATATAHDAVKLAKDIEKQIEGWQHLHKQPLRKTAGYDPIKHFKGDKSRLKPGSYIFSDEHPSSNTK